MRKHPLAECEKCPLQAYQHAPSDGPLDASIAVVSRSPGAYDVGAGKPFAGQAGKVLNHLLGLHDVKRKDVLATNVVLCRSDKPPQEAINACRPRLLSEIQACSTIIACGTEAVKELTGRKGVHDARGFAHEVNGHRVVATFNPAAALHDDTTFPDLVKDFRRALDPPPQPTLPEVSHTDDIETAKRWASVLLSNPPQRLAVDLETFGLDPRGIGITCAGFGRGDRAITFGLKPCSDSDFVRDYLKKLFELQDTKYLWHNGKFDCKFLVHRGINARVDDDTMLLSYALDERPGGHKLEYLLMEELAWPDYEPASVKEFKETGVLVDAAELYEYNALDCAGTFQLYEVLRERALEDNVLQFYQNQLVPASAVWVRGELTGIRYDEEEAADLWENEVMPQLDEWRAQLQATVGDGKFNPNSHVQCRKFMYDYCGLSHKLWRKQEREGNEESTDKFIRTEIIEGRAFASAGRKGLLTDFTQLLHEFKSLDKQRSTYIEGLIKKQDEDGRLRTDFKFHGTESGRYSSSGPNLQNITRPKAGLPNIRNLFIASEGYTLLQADYSQAELRTMAVVANEETLQGIYAGHLDLHTETARAFYGEDFTKEQRVYAKNINFGVGYGQGAKSFAQMYDMPVAEAKAYIEWWRGRFPRIETWREEIHATVLTVGELVNPVGRKRRFHLITNENKDHSLKEGVNWAIQSTAHEFTMWSAYEIHKELDYSQASILLDVHDSLLLECVPVYLSDLQILVKSVMESAPKEMLGWELPFTVDLAIGQRWGSLTELEEVNA